MRLEGLSRDASARAAQTPSSVCVRPVGGRFAEQPADRRLTRPARVRQRRRVRSRLRTRTLLRFRFRRLRWLRERCHLRSAPGIWRTPLCRPPLCPCPGSLRTVRLPIVHLRTVHLRTVRHCSWGCATRLRVDAHGRSSSAYAPRPCGAACPRPRCRSARRAWDGWSSACRPRCVLVRPLGEREPARAAAPQRSGQPRGFRRELRWPRSRLGSPSVGGGALLAVGARERAGILPASVATPTEWERVRGTWTKGGALE